MTRSAPALALLLATAVAAPPLAAQSLRAYAGSVAGQISGGGHCGTHGPSIPQWNAGLTVPLGGITACGWQGREDDHSASRGPVKASQSAFGPVVDGTYDGRASARADYGSLGVSASGVITGGVYLSIGGNPFYSPAPKFIENNFTIADGGLSGSGQVQSQFLYTVQAGTAFTFEAALRTSVQPCCYGATMSTAGGVTPVPEPGAGLLALAGLAVVGWRARRQLTSNGRRSTRRCALPARPAAPSRWPAPRR